MIEFALVVPVFALMLFGMIQFGLIFYGWDSLHNSVQTSARLVAIDDVPSGAPQTCPGLAAVEGATGVSPGTTATGQMYCEVLAQIGSPVGTTVDDSSNPPQLELTIANSVVTVCARVQAEAFTGFFPQLSMASSSEFYEERAGNLVSYQPYGVGNCVTLTLAVSVAGVQPLGTNVTAGDLSATLKGSSSQGSATATVSFYYFYTASDTPPNDCSSGGTGIGPTLAAPGDSQYSPDDPAGVDLTSPGYYWWYASYSGDPNNSSTNSGCGANMAFTEVS